MEREDGGSGQDAAAGQLAGAADRADPPADGAYRRDPAADTAAFAAAGNPAFADPAADTSAYGDPAADPAAYGDPAADPAAYGDPAADTSAYADPAADTASRPRFALPVLRLPRRFRRGTPKIRARLSPQLAADPRLPIWISRAAICIALGVVFGVWLGWRAGLTIAVVVAIADTILRSRTTAAIPAAVRVTRAQRQTSRRLAMLRPAGYLALNARRIPGSASVIDHLVVGPSGVFAIDSELWDRRLPVRIADRMLYHGPVNQKQRLAHARWEAGQAATLVSAELGQPVRVRPVMVIYGPNIPWTVSSLGGVDIFGGGTVGMYFRRQSRAATANQLDPGQVAAIFAAAGRALPPIRPQPGTDVAQ